MITNNINSPIQSNNNTIGAKKLKSEINSSHFIVAAPDSIYKYSVNDELKAIEAHRKELQKDIFEREMKKKNIRNFKSSMFFTGSVLAIATTLFGVFSLKK